MEVAEIVNEEPNGIIIQEQGLSEALAALEEALAQFGSAIKNLVTVSAKLSEKSTKTVKVDSVETRATQPPTEYHPSTVFSGDWSGTVNFTYTKYKGYALDYLGAEASTPFRLFYKTMSGASLGERQAQYRNGIYVVDGIQQPVPFYGVIYNDASSGSSQNATYYYQS
jgi:hypothetical protein